MFFETAMPKTVEPMKLSLETRAVHGGREDLHDMGVHALPIDLSSTYRVPDLAAAGIDLETLASGGHPATTPIYSRLHNPTVARFEKAFAGLEGTEEAVAFGSGMAAVTSVLMAARQRTGNGKPCHVVAIRPLYGGTDHLLASGLLGIDVSWARPDGIRRALRSETALVILETPANPTLSLVDLDEAVEQAGTVPVMVDSTFATPVLQNPARHGAAVVLHSATKFIGGHGDVLAGVVATDLEWARELRKIRVITGNVLHPLAAYLLHRGLPTLPLRVRHAQQGAEELAGRLLRHPRVTAVHYPGLGSSLEAAIMKKQMKGKGTILAFNVSGGFAAAARVMASVELMTPAVSLGSVDTLIQHPAALTHRVVEEGARRENGISESLLRVSVGLEDPVDLWADLEQALERV
ncbi:MAG: PLP-dependent transferase [Thermoanaerobaculia bacterium]|nr:PLP-dependent transferase [Thermoanaerobaculia bacterium]